MEDESVKGGLGGASRPERALAHPENAIGRNCIVALSIEERAEVLHELASGILTQEEIAAKHGLSRLEVNSLDQEAAHTGEVDTERLDRVSVRAFMTIPLMIVNKIKKGLTDNTLSAQEVSRYALAAGILFDKGQLAAGKPGAIIEHRTPMSHADVSVRISEAIKPPVILEAEIVTDEKPPIKP